MISIFVTATLIVGAAAALTRQAHRRRLAAEAEVRVLLARDRHRQRWINDAGKLIWFVWDETHVLDPRATALTRQYHYAAFLKELRRDGADHQGAVRIAEARLAHGMEVTV